ncbi:MAG: hypothetical protein JXA71_07285 [Chitinispirillaceae bacterium]|nr:hypothetical protein [Chitinispirillaceae bacterium]
MNTALRIVLAVAGMSLLCCFPPFKKTEKEEIQRIPAFNENVWLAPLIDKSGIRGMHIWPADTMQQNVLSGHIERIRDKLLSEFYRCEKYGHFTMVNDSLQSSIRVMATLERSTLVQDTIHMPVSIKVVSLADRKTWDFSYKVRGTAPPSRREGDLFHYCGLLLVDLSNSIPYRQIVYPFYREKK